MEHQEKKGKQLPKDYFKLCVATGEIPQQPNSFDCGVFVLLYSRAIIEEKPFVVMKSNESDEWRIKIASQIMNNSL